MAEADRIRPDVQELVDQLPSYPGRTSVLPYSVAAESVIYNVQMFEENGMCGGYARRRERGPWESVEEPFTRS